MSRFLDPLNVTEVDDVFFKIIDHPFRYQSDLGGLIAVPQGFRTDFASVPRLALIFSVLGDIAHQASVIHDWLYYAGLYMRRESDLILLEAMKETGIATWRRYPIYWGVRMGGWKPWNDHRKANHSPLTLIP